jgi:hypothetical protein
MIDVAEVINDPDFAQEYPVYRKTGVMLGGRWVSSEKRINTQGVVIAANTKDLLQVPEGDRVKGIMAFYSTEPLLVTSEAGTSDEAVWQEERYRLFQLFPYKDYGYYKALGERIAGD